MPTGPDLLVCPHLQSLQVRLCVWNECSIKPRWTRMGSRRCSSPAIKRCCASGTRASPEPEPNGMASRQRSSSRDRKDTHSTSRTVLRIRNESSTRAAAKRHGIGRFTLATQPCCTSGMRAAPEPERNGMGSRLRSHCRDRQRAKS